MSFETCDQLQNTTFFLLVELVVFNAILHDQDKLHKIFYFLNICAKTLNITFKVIQRDYIIATG